MIKKYETHSLTLYNSYICKVTHSNDIMTYTVKQYQPYTFDNEPLFYFYSILFKLKNGMII